jgi:hypothetical protein
VSMASRLALHLTQYTSGMFRTSLGSRILRAVHYNPTRGIERVRQHADRGAPLVPRRGPRAITED